MTGVVQPVASFGSSVIFSFQRRSLKNFTLSFHNNCSLQDVICIPIVVVPSLSLSLSLSLWLLFAYMHIIVFTFSQESAILSKWFPLLSQVCFIILFQR
jgi:hypothetical protein